MKIKYPKSTMIFVKTTEDCNLKCEHCYLGMEKPKDEFDPSKTARWLKEYQEETDSEIQLCIHGGEPLMVEVDNINYLINRLKEQDVEVKLSIATNLVYNLTPKKIELLKRIGNVATSWDAQDIRRFAYSSEHYTWYQNMQTMTNYVDMTIITSMSQGLINISPERYANKLIDWNTKFVILERLMGTANMPQSIVPKNWDVDSWCLELFDLTIEKEYYNIFSNVIFDSMIAAELYGGRPSTYSRDCNSQVLTLNANGTISGCPSNSFEVYGRMDNSIKDLFKSKMRVKFALHESRFNEVCFKCDQFDFCGGGCILTDWQGNHCNNLSRTMRKIRKFTKENPEVARKIVTNNKYITEVKNA